MVIHRVLLLGLQPVECGDRPASDPSGSPVADGECVTGSFGHLRQPNGESSLLDSSLDPHPSTDSNKDGPRTLLSLTSVWLSSFSYSAS